MEGIFLPIVIAAAVVLLVVGVIQLAKQLLDPERRKLHERLSTEANSGAGSKDSFTARSTRLETQTAGLSASLSKMPLLIGLHRRLLHAYPDLSLAGFLIIVLLLGIVGFTI